MNPKIPIAIGVAGILAGIATAIASANGAFAGHPRLYVWLYGGAAVLIAVALVLALTTTDQKTPHIVATRYGRGTLETGIKSRGYPTGEWGLIVVSDEEPAYEISIYPSVVVFNGNKLHFGNRITRLTKLDGEAEISAWIETPDRGSVLGSGLFEFMRQNRIDEINISVLYKGARNRWYKSICKIERDVTVSGGLAVRTEFHGRARKPQTVE